MDKIMPPRVPFIIEDESEEQFARRERLVVGTKWAGIVIDITNEGISFNGYYSEDYETKSCNLMKWSLIPWDDIEKARVLVGLSPAKRKAMAVTTEFEIDDVPDKKYLASLPQVNLNDRMYYLDGERKERRLVSNPRHVFKYESIIPVAVEEDLED